MPVNPINPSNLGNQPEDKPVQQVLSFDDAQYEAFIDRLLEDDDLYNEYQAAVTRAKLAAAAAKS